MKYLKLFESRQTESEVAFICSQLLIDKWSINSDGLVDVDEGVYIYGKELTKLPLRFGYVSGDFDCEGNKLIDLEGCPLVVGGYFDCSRNELTSLEGSPKSVGGRFFCHQNKLTSLRFAPEEIEGSVILLPNPISDIPKEYLTREYLKFIVKEQFDWNLYRKDGSIYTERLEQMIEWGIETNKITKL